MLIDWYPELLSQTQAYNKATPPRHGRIEVVSIALTFPS
jgi:hypothetical protein